jgi:hypothetical protein
MARRRSGHPDEAGTAVPVNRDRRDKRGDDGRENKVRIQEKPKWLLKK